MTKKIIIGTLFSFFAQLNFAQNVDKNKLDNYFSALAESNKFMGSMSLAENGKTIFTNSLGFSDIENQKKINENTKFRIGSISKVFTSVLIFKAIENKKLSLETKLNQFFPSIKNSEKITIGNLLNHRSGILNFTDAPDYYDWNTQKKSEIEMIQIFSKAGSTFEPNSQTSYSNSNYVILSYILQKLYKKSYSDLLQEKIVKPLDLKNTYFGGKTDLNKNEAYSYKYTTKWTKEPETDTSVPLGAGGIVSTSNDLTQFIFALFNGKLVSESSLKMMTNVQENVGYGLFQFPFGDEISYGHTGGIDGFKSVVGYFPKEKIAVAVISNANNYNLNNVSLTLIKSAFGKPFEIPSFKSFEVSSENLDQYLGVYSDKDFPLKITFTKDGKTLFAQATGQPIITLDAVEKDKFKFDQAGVKIEFQPNDKTMLLTQGGMTFKLMKE